MEGHGVVVAIGQLKRWVVHRGLRFVAGCPRSTLGGGSRMLGRVLLANYVPTSSQGKELVQVTDKRYPRSVGVFRPVRCYRLVMLRAPPPGS